MKASQIIKRYAIGERDFQRENLRGLSFQGADFSGADFSDADFSDADIRGTNFKYAILRRTKFCGAKAGLPRDWTFLEGIGIGGVLAIFVRTFVYAFAFAVTVAVTMGEDFTSYLPAFFVFTLPFTFASAFAAGGTSFYNANLTDADFSRATLKNTDLRAKSLTRTCFTDAKKLIQARVGKTILADSKVRELLVTGYGYKKSYINANLRGAYLAAANLSYANLTQADLAEANLQQANLEWANLTQINAIGTDFTKTSMTGACLEAWNIESSTKLDEVDCRFVYLLKRPKPGTDDRERRPSSGDFQAGEFSKLFE